MLIDCDSCAMRNIACSDCVVTMLLGAHDDEGTHEAGHSDLDDDERRAVELLAEAGLISPLRLVPISRANGRNQAQNKSIA